MVGVCCQRRRVDNSLSSGRPLNMPSFKACVFTVCSLLQAAGLQIRSKGVGNTGTKASSTCRRLYRSKFYRHAMNCIYIYIYILFLELCQALGLLCSTAPFHIMALAMAGFWDGWLRAEKYQASRSRKDPPSFCQAWVRRVKVMTQRPACWPWKHCWVALFVVLCCDSHSARKIHSMP